GARPPGFWRIREGITWSAIHRSERHRGVRYGTRRKNMIKLNLGCNDRHLPDHVNVDRVAPADVVTDLEQRWPWENSTVEHIVAHDIIEHLHDKIHTMNEAHRVLAPAGTIEIAVPTTDGPGAWCDP